VSARARAEAEAPAAPSCDAPRLALDLTLHHEGVLANLLEALLFCDRVAEAASEDALLELADYGVRSARLGRHARARI
jgi:hypothetical protein